MTSNVEHTFANDFALLSRIEDAGLNASAPAQQLWLDGWLVRFSPGKAQRARCVNALARGHSSFDEQLQRVAAIYRSAELPFIVRITPFSQPTDLDARLAERGFERYGDTAVMVRRDLAQGQPVVQPQHQLPAGLSMHAVGTHVLAQVAGQLRHSPLAQRQAHAQRLEQSPVPLSAFAIRRDADGVVLACGQVAVEGDLLGIYDVVTAEEARNQGLASFLCEYMLLQLSKPMRTAHAYLQVEADNRAARRVYARLGFADAYQYHYRRYPEGS